MDVKYTAVYRGENAPRRTDVLWVHHSVKNDLTSPIVVQSFSKGRWVDAYDKEDQSDIERLTEQLGDITTLETTAQDSVVNAINEVVGNTGDLDDLTTTEKTTLVGAINEAATSGDPASLLYTAQTLTDEQKAQARANVGAASEAELQALNSGEVVPVASLPTASASTMGKVYLVGPDANDEYDRYVSSYDGTDYTWVQIGTTEMDLSGYATEEELSELELKVNGKTFNYTSSILTDGAYIDADTGNDVSNSYRSRTDYVEVQPKTTIQFKVYGTVAPQGYALYDVSKQYVSGQEYHNGQGNDVSLVVPDNVHYIRITWYNSSNANFSSFSLSTPFTGMDDDISDLKNDVSDIQQDVANIQQNVTSLESSLDTLEDKFYGVSQSLDNSILTDGKYINGSTGNEVTQTYRSCSDFLPVISGAKVSFAYVTGFAFYDENKNYVSGNEDPSGQIVEVNTIVPEGVSFIRVSFFYSSSTSFNLFHFEQIKDGTVNSDNYVAQVKKGVATITKYTNYTDLEENKAYRTDGTTIGNPQAHSGTSCLMLSVKEGDVFVANGNGGTNTVSFITTTNSSKTIVRKFTGNYRYNPLTVTIASGEEYLVVNFIAYDSTIDKIEKTENYTLNGLYDGLNTLSAGIDSRIDAVSRNWFWKGKNVVVFGDSITEFKSILSGGKGWVDEFEGLSGANIYNGAIGGSRISARRATVQAVDNGETALENSYRAYNCLDVVNLVHEWANADYTIVDTNVTWLANNVSDDNSGQIQHLKDMPIGDTDIVIISAGSNDWHNGSVDGENTLDNFNVQQVYGALNCIVKDILSANTKIQVYFLTPIPRYTTKNVPTFSTEESYAVDDIVKYSDVDYVFTSAHSPGAWDASEVRVATALDFRRDEYSSDVVVVNGRTLKQFSENLTEHIHKYHTPVVNMYDNIGFNKYNWSQYFPDNDNTHPHKGYIYFGQKVYRLILAL